MSKFKKKWLYGGLIILLLTFVGFYLFVFDYYEPIGAFHLDVYEINVSTAQQGTIVHLTEQDFKEHPVLAEMIKGEKNFERLFRKNGVIPDHEEARTIIDKFSWNTATGQKYVEYMGNTMNYVYGSRS
jgi:hypothetical protein